MTAYAPVYPRHLPSPSEGAKRIENLRSLLLRAEWLHPGINAERVMFEVPDKLRMEAHYLITASTVDMAFMAFVSREKAAGRVYRSEAEAKQVFSQAGVVAPPESLIPEISTISGQGA